MGGLGLEWGGTGGPRKPAMVWPLVVGPPPGLGVGQEGPEVDLQGGLWSVLVKQGRHTVEGRPGGYCPSSAIASGPFKWPLGLPCPSNLPSQQALGLPFLKASCQVAATPSDLQRLCLPSCPGSTHRAPEA